ncbi:MAG: hypothetical protein Q8920_16945 [Bacillota bacterium]|nr:hypothetical protein [Bacillota bacterium]
MNNRKELPVAQSPITGLQYLAYPLSILLNHKECFPWFYSNYIQLQWNKKFAPHFTFFIDNFLMNIPWLDMPSLNRRILQFNKIDLELFIINSIDEGYYFHSYFDEFFIPNRLAFQNQHFVHDFMITGYDLEKREYTILGFTKGRVFETCNVTFSDFYKAYNSTECLERGNYWEYQVKLLRKTEDIKYEFDMHNVYDLLQDYLFSRDSSQRLRLYRNPESINIYGMEVYTYLRKYLGLLIKKEVARDLRPLYIFYEHKKCMAMRIKYMIENKFIQNTPEMMNTFVNIENSASLLYKLQIKHQFNNNPEMLQQIIERLYKLEDVEKQVMELTLEAIYKKI